MEGGAGQKACAGITREAPEKTAATERERDTERERKSQGKPHCSFCIQEEDLHFSVSHLSSLHAAAS